MRMRLLQQRNLFHHAIHKYQAQRRGKVPLLQMSKHLCSTSSSPDNNLVNRFNWSQPDKTVFFVPNHQSTSYLQFQNQISHLSKWLTDRHGIRKEDRVAVQAPKSPQIISLYLATLSIGAVYVPLNSDYTEKEIEFFLSDCAPKVIVCDPTKHSSSSGVFSSSSKVKAIDYNQVITEAGSAGNSGEFLAAPVNPHSLAQLIYTSGTTGRPKGAMVTHDNLISNADALCEIWSIANSDTLVHALPVNHVHGLNVALNTILLSGGSFVFLPKFNLESVLHELGPDGRATLMMGVPTFYTRLLASPTFQPSSIAKDRVRLFISGSAPLLPQTLHDFKDRSGGYEMLERYGMTEGQMVLSQRLDEPRRPGNVGRPLPGVQVRINKHDNSLEYKSRGTCRGYWDLPEKTKEAFTEDGFFRSGDIVEEDKATGNISIVGRQSDMIISGGLNIYPKEIEVKLDAYSRVEESAVFGVPHPDFGEVPIAAVVLTSIAHNDTDTVVNEINDALKLQLAPYKRPKQILVVDALPRNAMGKVQKKELRQKHGKRF